MPCSHYWLAETPNGPKTRMVCKYCPAVKYEKSYMSDLELNRVVLYGSKILYGKMGEKQEVEV